MHEESPDSTMNRAVGACPQAEARRYRGTQSLYDPAQTVRSNCVTSIVVSRFPVTFHDLRLTHACARRARVTRALARGGYPDLVRAPSSTSSSTGN